VLKISNTGPTTTQTFTTGASWSLAYSFNCGEHGRPGNFIVGDTAGGTLVNAFAMTGSATVYERADAGTHALAINSDCWWTVTATNWDSGA